jgi:hypothetical protein
LQANRGALNSNVTSDRTIAQTRIGGDVNNTDVQSGYNQGLLAQFHSQTAPTNPPNAQDGGALQDVLIAGNVMNSVFTASVQPLNNTFGTSDLNFPHGRIKAKVEGSIDNSTATPNSPAQAFYAKSVEFLHGPVTPPNVPEEPLPVVPGPPQGIRIKNSGLQPFTTTTSTTTGSGATVSTTRVPRTTPAGPAAQRPRSAKRK